MWRTRRRGASSSPSRPRSVPESRWTPPTPICSRAISPPSSGCCDDPASVRLGYAIAGRGAASLAAVFIGDRDDYDYGTFPAARGPLPPHTRLDVAGTYDLVPSRGTAPGLALAARIENLLDARYEDVKNFPARGRTLLFGGRVTFGP